MSSRRSVMSGFAWVFLEKVSSQAVSFVVSIVLARILAPSDYGMVAVCMIFITFSEVIVTNGFGTALIQKKDPDNIDYSTVFHFQFVFSLVLYAIIFFLSPIIIRYFGEEYGPAIPVLRVLGLRLIISAINNVQQAYVSKNMIFKKFFKATLWGTMISAVVGLFMAYTGFGVWAIVGQYLTNSIIDTIVLYLSIDWHPKWLFSKRRLSELLPFSWKLLVNSTIDTAYSQMRALVIGKIYTPSDLAYFNRGQTFPTLIESNVNQSISSVLFPAISNVQDNKDSVLAMMRRSIKVSAYIMTPLLVGLALIAEPMVKLLLTDKWMPCVPYIWSYCLVLSFNPIHTVNIQGVKALGRSDVILKINLVNKVIGLSVLFSVMHISVFWIAYSMIGTSVVGVFVNGYPNRKILGYKYSQQFKDIAPSYLLSFFMFAIAYPIVLFQLSPALTIFIQIVFAFLLYIGLSYLMKVESFFYLKEIAVRFTNDFRNVT